MSETRRIRLYALSCALALALTAAIRFAPSPYAPRVNIRWADAVSAEERAQLEERLGLREPAHHEGNTWVYDLVDSSSASVRAVLSDPAVADTHHIDRFAGVVSAGAPRGTTRVGGDFALRWRDSATVYWLFLFSASGVVVSAAWLLAATRSQRHTLNDLR